MGKGKGISLHASDRIYYISSMGEGVRGLQRDDVTEAIKDKVDYQDTDTLQRAFVEFQEHTISKENLGI